KDIARLRSAWGARLSLTAERRDGRFAPMVGLQYVWGLSDLSSDKRKRSVRPPRGCVRRPRLPKAAATERMRGAGVTNIERLGAGALPALALIVTAGAAGPSQAGGGWTAAQELTRSVGLDLEAPRLATSPQGEMIGAWASRFEPGTGW